MGGRGKAAGKKPQRPTLSATFNAGGVELKVTAETVTTVAGTQQTKVTSTRKLRDGTVVEAATAEFAHRGDGELRPLNVTVEPALQRRGVATKMYEMAQQLTGRKIIASESQTAEGRALSEAFRRR